MRAVSEECGLQPVTVAMAYVYFEKLVLQGRLNKHNRKLVSAACVLLAAKISSDLKKHEVKQLIDVSVHTQECVRVCVSICILCSICAFVVWTQHCTLLGDTVKFKLIWSHIF